MNPDNPTSTSDAPNASLADLAALHRDQQARKVDVVAPAQAIRARAGQLVVAGTAPELRPDGVSLTSQSPPRAAASTQWILGQACRCGYVQQWPADAVSAESFSCWPPQHCTGADAPAGVSSLASTASQLWPPSWPQNVGLSSLTV